MERKNSDPEKLVEERLRIAMRRCGGRAYKWVSPGSDGVPDRLCFFPDGRVYAVEIKGCGGRYQPSQKKRFPELASLGMPVYVLWSKQDADRFVEEMVRGGERLDLYPVSLSGLLYSADHQ